MRRLLLPLLSLSLLASLAPVARADHETPRAPVASYVRVPRVIGMTPADAARALDASGLRADLGARPGRPGSGLVVHLQEPAAGLFAPAGASVRLTLAALGDGRTQDVRMRRAPDLAGASAFAARARLEAAGFRVVLREVLAPDADLDVVLAQSPSAGALVGFRREFVLYVAEVARVPDVVGRRVRGAEFVLAGAGFETRLDRLGAGRLGGFGAGRLDAVVAAQSPRAGTLAAKGSEVSLTLRSAGPLRDAVRAPDVVGLDLHAATQALRAAGLEAEVRSGPFHEPWADGRRGGARVVAQDRPAGSLLPVGTVVRLDVALDVDHGPGRGGRGPLTGGTWRG
jgi:beta-lactam-binding protein with PASTA domain